MVNWPGVSGVFTLLRKPIIPTLLVKDITELNFAAFKRAGISGVVIDKDNCITKPHHDELAPGLKESWDQLLHVFGPENVLVVSNSAGSSKDSNLLQAESVSRHLRVPILIHSAPKPAKTTAKQIKRYFSNSLTVQSTAPRNKWKWWTHREVPDGSVVWTKPLLHAHPKESSAQVLVIGDRVTTDLILSYRLSQLSGEKETIHPISILTTGLHARESFGTTFMRFMENTIIRTRMKRFPNPARDQWGQCLFIPLNTYTEMENNVAKKQLEKKKNQVPLSIGVRRFFTQLNDRRFWVAGMIKALPGYFTKDAVREVSRSLLLSLQKWLATRPKELLIRLRDRLQQINEQHAKS